MNTQDRRRETPVEPVETNDLDKLDRRRDTPVETPDLDTTPVEPVETPRRETLVEPVETFSVLVAVLTFRRPADIAELAPQLVQHAVEASKTIFAGAAFGVGVLVVDNDPAAGARPLIQPLDAVRYVHEPQPGIAAARNRALSEGHSADLLVFIDDDERPLEGWLTALLSTWLVDRPAAVSGHVLSLFDDDIDPWIRAGNYFHRPNPPTGTELPALASGNLLLDLGQIRAWNLTFDERYGLTGGEDTHFTRRIRSHGGRLVWCRESRTTDRVPTTRLTRRWLAVRAFRGGNCAARIELDVATGSRIRVILANVAHGLSRLTAGSARWLFGLCTGRLDHRAKATRTLMRGLGYLAGATGYAHREYGRTAQVKH